MSPLVVKDKVIVGVSGGQYGVRDPLGGGTTWDAVSYDPEFHLIYYGPANPGTWNPVRRPGHLLTVFAIPGNAWDGSFGPTRCWRCLGPSAGQPGAARAELIGAN